MVVVGAGENFGIARRALRVRPSSAQAHEIEATTHQMRATEIADPAVEADAELELSGRCSTQGRFSGTRFSGMYCFIHSVLAGEERSLHGFAFRSLHHNRSGVDDECEP